MFFTALVVVFGIAVWVRLSAYQIDDQVGSETVQNGTVTETGRSATDHTTPAETGTIVDASPAGAATSTMSARQQRYNELLRNRPAAAPTAPQPPKESFLDRVVNPIASVLGIDRAKPTSANVAPAKPQPNAQQRQQQPQQRDESQQNPQGDDKPKEEQDPDTDVTPPQLLGAEFVPAQVQDNGETMLAAYVTDNLSGVRSVSGVIANPTGGGLQGFACQREGETDRFVARIKVPPDAAEGEWSVKYLTLSDNANNSVNINQASGQLPMSAKFRVSSSSSDSSAPLLRGVYLEKNAMNAGERNTIFVQAEDEKSGVSLVSGVFVSPSKQARIGFGCRPGAAGAWECTISPPACLDCGAWQLEQIQVQDKANNMATFRGDNENVGRVVLNISGDSCDAGPPQITTLGVSPAVVSNAQGGTIIITATVQDDACGVASLSGQAIPAGATSGQRIPFSFDPSPDGQNFTGRIIVPKHAAKGLWTIGWIQALDKGHNLRAYGAAEPVLQRVTFRVE